MTEEIAAWFRDARARMHALADALEPATLLGPRIAIVNPPLWELGHVAWFQERWLLRREGAPSSLPGADALYDSSAVAHDRRWELPLPDLAATRDWLGAVERAARARLAAGRPEDDAYARLAVFHEDMHWEAMAFSRQTLALAAPRLPGVARLAADAGDLPGDAAVPGGAFTLGARGDESFVFDNELDAHEVALAPFAIARAPVTQARYAEFVADGGYRRRELWSAEGWAWRAATHAEAPAYWERRDGAWARREFDRLVPLAPHRPMVNACWWEAEAFCRWAGRRLPSEAEWEAAAAGEPAAGGRLAARRRRYPWGEGPPTPELAHLDARALHAIDVAALPAGDSAFGCRQMLGNVWEWTASDFLPYPGFAPGAYREYSAPWFGTHKSVRGGGFATPARLVRCAFRNFYTPDRRDPWIGFRTCAA